MAQTAELSIGELRSRIPTLKAGQEVLEDKGWYVPEYSKNGHILKCWTFEWFHRLITGQAFKIKREDIRLPPTNIREGTVEYIIEEIEKYTGQVKMEFMEDQYPSKEWLLNVLYTLNKHHEAFQKPGKLDSSRTQVFDQG